MQVMQATYRWIVTDGDSILCSGSRAKCSRYLEASTFVRADGTEIPLKQAGFKLEKREWLKRYV